MKNRKYFTIPTVFTAFNLFCGFSAIVLTSAGKYVDAVWLIILAALFDAFDGKIARASGKSSDFGLQMDSLGDVVSSGLAPSLLVYQVHLKVLGPVGLILAFLPLLFAAFRLARFNVLTLQDGKSDDYLGLPAPMGAITLSSIVLMYLETHWHFLLPFLVAMVPLVGWLMAGTLRYDGFPRFSIKEKGKNRIKLLIMLTALVLLPFFSHYVVFTFTMFYLVSGFIKTLIALNHSEESEVELFPEKVE